jgi:hypothetical protein
MIVQHGGNNNSSNQNKGAIYNAIKAVAKKSILILTPRAKVINGYH